MIAREFIGRIVPRVQPPPEWGIEPVPLQQRLMGFLDYFVLWGDLGVGMLVLVAGSLLVPGLGLGQAFLAIAIGSIIGSLLLSLAGRVGSDNAVPTMVLLRPVLGLRGSYLPSVLNILQLIGWTIFEVIIMAKAADVITKSLTGLSSYPLWAFFFAAFCTFLAIGGPLVVVRQWLEKFAVWLVFATSLWLTYYLFTNYDIASLLSKEGTGEMPFWLAVDLVIAMPISWLPLVADYNRFARRSNRAFWGTGVGYTIANVWFYGLGTLLLLALSTNTGDLIPAMITAVTAVAAGWLFLLVILVDETDNAFADIYSAAVSVQNIFPQIKQLWSALVIGGLVFITALIFDITQYENFLLFIGSFFVPLFGVLAADYFIVRRGRYEIAELYRTEGSYWYWRGFNWPGLMAWAVGFATYRYIHDSLSWLGASVPSFVVALILYVILARITVRATSGRSA